MHVSIVVNFWFILFFHDKTRLPGKVLSFLAFHQ